MNSIEKSIFDKRRLSQSSSDSTDRPIADGSIGCACLEDAHRIVAHHMTDALGRLCGKDYYLQESLVLIHAPDSRFPTTELHLLAATPFGAFLVHVIDHRGHLLTGPTEHMLTFVDERGEPTWRTCPLRRQQPALRRLRATLNVHGCPVYRLAVAAHAACILDPGISDSIIGVSDLFYVVRRQRAQFFGRKASRVSVSTCAHAVEQHADLREEALHEHRARAINSHLR